MMPSIEEGVTPKGDPKTEVSTAIPERPSKASVMFDFPSIDQPSGSSPTPERKMQRGSFSVAALSGGNRASSSQRFSLQKLRALSSRLPSLADNTVLDDRETVIRELKRDHQRICLSMDEVLELEDDDVKSKRVSKPVASMLAVTSGVFVVVQIGFNATLRREYIPSALSTSATQYLVGIAVSLIISTLQKFPKDALSHLSTFGEIPWYAYLGGVLGACYVTAAIVLSPTLGFAAFQIAAVAGQLISGIICDAIGFLHLVPSQPTPYRIICTVLVLSGTALCAKWGGDSGKTWEVAVYLFLAMTAGGVFPIQACVNYELSRHLGTPFRAVAMNFLVGSIAMWGCVAIEFGVKSDSNRPVYQVQELEETDWWAWIGGLFGSLLICGVTLGIPALGAVSFTLIFVSTQLVSAVVADHIGAFGYKVVPINAFGGTRIAGALLAISAAAAFRLKPPKWLSCLNSWPCKRWKTKSRKDTIEKFKQMQSNPNYRRSSFIARIPLDFDLDDDEGPNPDKTEKSDTVQV